MTGGQREKWRQPLPVAECPLCSDPQRDVHIRHEAACVFTAGSLYCVVPDCRNAHHRQRPS
jgi:hypothetical protein